MTQPVNDSGPVKRAIQKAFQAVERGRSDSPRRYYVLRRNIMLVMLLVTLIPLTLMAVINYLQYQSNIETELKAPLAVLANKAKHSFELFLNERLSMLKSIASGYSFDDLASGNTLNRIFLALKNEVGGFVDLGVIDTNGTLVAYSGPYDLLGRDYTSQDWYHEMSVRGDYISDVFMGYRNFPHISLATQRLTEEGGTWILRATIDTFMFDRLIASMGLDPESDAFLVNRMGILQTRSRLYGDVLEQNPFCIPRGSYGTYVVEETDPAGREVIMVFAHLEHPDYVLALVKPRSVLMKNWYALKGEMFLIFIVSAGLIVLIVYRITETMTRRIREADEKRELAFREIEHTHKLSSIGRLAAGVAHEINNPLAIINEKAGLLKDLVGQDPNSPQSGRYNKLADSMLQSVERCKTITHRLLGFARRMEVTFVTIDLNELIREVLGFLEKEALHRSIQVTLEFQEDLVKISSDRGQLQQVFLNILSNAFAAVEDGGRVLVRTWQEDGDTVGASVQDNGCGMSQETLRHIFEPFFTTKKGYGTGLGLAITYGIAKKLGGDIKVDSRLDEGTTFRVYLPVKPPAGSED